MICRDMIFIIIVRAQKVWLATQRVRILGSAFIRREYNFTYVCNTSTLKSRLVKCQYALDYRTMFIKIKFNIRKKLYFRPFNYITFFLKKQDLQYAFILIKTVMLLYKVRENNNVGTTNKLGD